MNALSTLQNNFQNCLLQQQYEWDEVISTHKVPASVRLGIYIDAYRARLTEALITHYPVLQLWLGEGIFRLLAEDYIKTHASGFRSIRWFGHQLAAFLRSLKAENYIIEMAEFEWVLTEVFDGKDSPIISVEAMAAIPPNDWAKLQFELHPAARRLNLHWNVVAIWQAFSHEKALPEITCRETATPWLLWRQDLINQFRSLSAAEAWMIDAILGHADFAEICEGLCTWFNEAEVGNNVAAILKNFIQAGLISEAHVPAL